MTVEIDVAAAARVRRALVASHLSARPARRGLSGVVALVLALGVAVSPSVRAAETATSEYPAGYERYHTYAEVGGEVGRVAAAHPAIVRKFSIGRSYQGRELWAAKISDNVLVDEREPEVLFDGGQHSREPLGVEMGLYLLHQLATGYSSDTRIKRIVDTREVWILFMINPDGYEYDISGGKFHLWRKNRQPTSGTTSIGTDLNRNYDYHWGCCTGSSSNPDSLLYRGPYAFSAPETRAVRDFVNSRVVGGRQQITTALSFHVYGRIILYPYSHTYADVPPDMTRQDHDVLVAMSRGMSSRNGYSIKQGSDLYLMSGVFRDWLYGRHRIFAWTFELGTAFYPDPDTAISTETTKNRSTLLYILEQADCPYRSIGAAASNCGPLFDDFEIARGWQVNAFGTDTATVGRFERGDPQATSSSGAKQLGTATSGSAVLVTGRLAGSTASAYDLDGGVTSVRSPEIRLSGGTSFRLSFRYYFAHSASSSRADYLRVKVLSAGGTTTVFQELGSGIDDDASWATASVDLSAYAGQTVRLLVQTADGAGNSLVEAAIDDVRVTRR